MLLQAEISVLSFPWVEAAEHVFAQVERRIRQIIPPDQLETVLDNIGLPAISINLVYSDAETLGAFDGEILIAFNDRRKRSDTWKYLREIRNKLPKEFPSETFFFQSPDIVNQILNFGLPAPINVQISGPNTDANYALAEQLRRRISEIPGAADTHLHQSIDYLELRVDVDRTRADELGLTQRDVANSLLVPGDSAQWATLLGGPFPECHRKELPCALFSFTRPAGGDFSAVASPLPTSGPARPEPPADARRACPLA